tara:strand:- start:69 stop:323 length:255 start_codon:yes stop_codon:yes gene_type:complete
MSNTTSEDLFDSDDENVNTIDNVKKLIEDHDNIDDKIRENIWLVLELLKKEENRDVRESIYNMILKQEKKNEEVQEEIEGCNIQ